MKGLCSECFGSNKTITINSHDGNVYCTACLKRTAEKLKPIEPCNCRTCPVHNNIESVPPIQPELSEG